MTSLWEHRLNRIFAWLRHFFPVTRCSSYVEFTVILIESAPYQTWCRWTSSLALCRAPWKDFGTLHLFWPNSYLSCVSALSRSRWLVAKPAMFSTDCTVYYLNFEPAWHSLLRPDIMFQVGLRGAFTAGWLASGIYLGRRTYTNSVLVHYNSSSAKLHHWNVIASLKCQQFSNHEVEK